MDGDEQAINPAERRRRLRSAWWVVAIACLLGLAVIGAKWARFASLHSWKSQCISNMHLIAGAATRCGDQTGVAPSTMGQFQAAGWFTADCGEEGMKEVPINPYSAEPLKLLSLGDKPTAGDLFYLPALKTYTMSFEYKSEKREDGFLVVAFGLERGIDFYIDIDGNGIADPVIGFTSSAGSYRLSDIHEFDHAWGESPEETLARHGYTHKLEEAMLEE